MCAQVVVEMLGTEVSYSHLHKDGVDWVFVDHVSFQREGGLYGDAHGVYGDNQVLPVQPTPHALPSDSPQVQCSVQEWCMTSGVDRRQTRA